MSFTQSEEILEKEVFEFLLRTKRANLLELLGQKTKPIRIDDLAREYLTAYPYLGDKVSNFPEVFSRYLTTLQAYDLITVNNDLEAMLTDNGSVLSSELESSLYNQFQNKGKGRISITILDMLTYLSSQKGGKAQIKTITSDLSLSGSSISRNVERYEDLFEQVNGYGKDQTIKLSETGKKTAKAIEDSYKRINALIIPPPKQIERNSRFETLIKKISPRDIVSAKIGLTFVYIEGPLTSKGQLLESAEGPSYFGNPETSRVFTLEKGKGINQRIEDAARTIAENNPFYTFTDLNPKSKDSSPHKIEIFSYISEVLETE
jgi:hypothetical protein